MEQYILALDQGTTSSRSLIINDRGQIKNISQKEFEQIFPSPGWVEHDPNEIWSSQLSTIKSIIDTPDSVANKIAAVGITNQRETTIVWNKKTSEPVYNAIVWQDRRTSDYCKELSDSEWKEKIHHKTGLIVDAYFSATKLKWILDNVDGVRDSAEKGELIFGTVDSWLMYKLTNGKTHATDVSNASRTMMYNIREMDWDDELLELFNIPKAMLPEVRSSMDDYGEVDNSILEGNVKIASAIGDQQSALFGQLCFEKGMMKNTYGTGCFLVLNTGTELKYSTHNLLSTVAWRINDTTHYALEGSVFIGGAIIQWLRDGLEIIKNSSDIEDLSNEVNDNGGVFFVPALTGLGAPYWDSQARGAIFGITRGTKKGHIARAAVESIAFQVFDLVEAMNKDLGEDIKSLNVDGGASANNYLMQLQSDLINAEVVRPSNLETTALGAAFLAGLQCGIWKDQEGLKSNIEIGRNFQPSGNKTELDKKVKFWRRAVQRSLEWLNV